MRKFVLWLGLNGVILGVAALGWAGHYEVTMSGGGPFHITGPSGIEWTSPYDGNGASCGGSAYSVDPPGQGQNPVPGPGSVSATGEITATFTWTPDSTNDDEPAPSVVIIKQHAEAFWSGGPGQASDGLGDDVSPPDDYYGTSAGTHYEVLPTPGETFTRKCTPTVQVVFSPLAGPEFCTATVLYEAAAYPVRITYAGVLDANDPNTQRLLIGQKLRATVDLGGLATSGQNTFTWNIAGGQPFTDYVPGPLTDGANNTETVYTTWAETIHHTTSVTDNVTTAFAGEDSDAVVSCRVVTLSPAFDITVSKKLKIDHPILDKDILPVIGTFKLTPNTSSPSTLVLLLSTGADGWSYRYWASTPAPYRPQGLGRFCGVQLVTDTGTATLQVGGTVNLAYYTETCLDGGYPYPLGNSAWQPAGDAPPNPSMYRFFLDRPFNSVDYLSEIVEHSDFEDYVMYEPPANGVGVLNVPLWVLPWHAYGTATQGTPWVFDDSSGAAPAVTTYPLHPRWTHLWKKNGS